MNLHRILRPSVRSLCILSSIGLVSCASFEHPLTRHDLDGDGALSHSEYQQNNMQYNIAGRQREDEYGRARLLTDHIFNAGDMIAGVNRGFGLLRNFGR